MNPKTSHAGRRFIGFFFCALILAALVVAGLKTKHHAAAPMTTSATAVATTPGSAPAATRSAAPPSATTRRVIRDQQQPSSAVSPPLSLIAQGGGVAAVAVTTPGTPAGSAAAGAAGASPSPKAPVPAKVPATKKKASAPVFAPLVSPTPEQIRDQPAAKTAAQVLTQRLNLDDPATRAEVERVLKTSAELRKKAAWERAKQLGIPTAGDTPGGGRFELQDFEGDRPVYHQSTNVNAAISTAADKVRYNDPLYYVDGSGDEIGLWEAGGIPLRLHQEFTVSGISRVNLNPGQTANSSSHATHVAGTLIGSGITMVNGLPHALRGMAPAAAISAYDSTNDTGEMALAGATQSNQFGRLLVSNHSYGPAAGWNYDAAGNTIWLGPYTPDANPSDDFEPLFGQYGDESTTIDGLLCSTPYYLPFFAAGNDRTDTPPNSGGLWYWLNTSGTPGGYVIGRDPRGDGEYKNGFDTLSGGGQVSKNTLTLGAVSDAATYGSRNAATAAMTDFSSWGPADDGRIKPDIVANGQDVLSANNPANNASIIKSGTSMATPNACGSALLLQQIYRNHTGETMRADKLKALIIHTADDLGNPGPDYKTGWGLMNARRAADAIEGVTSAQLLEGQISTGQQAEYFNAIVTSGQALRVTLCWTDPAGAVDTTHDNQTPDLVNDLDLVVTGPTGVIYRPYTMPYVGQWTKEALELPATTGVNHTDNVEQVYFPAPVAGTYLVTVTKTGGIAAPGFQEYALIIGAEPPPDIAVSPATVNFDCVCCGAVSEPVEVTIRNTGLGLLKNLSAAVEGADAASFSISALPVTQLNSGDSTKVMVTYTAPATGTSSATLHIESNDPDEPTVDIPLGASLYSTTVTLHSQIPLTAPAFPAAYALSAMTEENDVVVFTHGQYSLDDYGPLWNEPGPGHLAAYLGGGGGWQKDFPAVSGQYIGGEVLATNQAGTEVALQQILVQSTTASNYQWAGSVVVYDLSDGNVKWQATDSMIGGLSFPFVPSGIVFDHQGALIAARGEIRYNYVDQQYRLTKYSPAGDVIWDNINSDAAISTEHRSIIAVDASDNIFVLESGFLGKFSGTGAKLWSHALAAPGGEPLSPAAGVAVNGTGDVFIAGYYQATSGDTSRKHRFVQKLSGATGNALWSSMGPVDGDDDHVSHMAIDARGDVAVTGPKFTVNHAPVSWITSKLSGANGAQLWQKEFGPDASLAGTYDLKIDRNGHVIIAGVSGPRQIYRFKKYASKTGNLLWESCHDHANLHPGYYPQSYFTLNISPPAPTGETKLAVVAGPEALFKYTAPIVNNSPVLGVVQPVLVVNEGATVSNSGSRDIGETGDIVTYSATRNEIAFGTVAATSPQRGWGWSLDTTDGPNESGTVTIAAEDGVSLPGTVTFQLTVNNVAPAFSTGGDVTLTAAEALLFSRAITFTDPGTDFWVASVNYGDGGGNQVVSVNQAAKSLDLSHSFIGIGPWTVTVTIDDGDPGGITTHSFIVSIGAARTLNDWRMTHFGTTDNTGDAADLANPAKDGIANLLKFAFNLDPHQNLPVSALPQPSFGGGGGGGSFAAASSEAEASLGPGDSMTFSFTEPAGTTGITYGAESSTNLTSWQSVADTGTGGTHTFSVPLSTNTRLFMRLKVTTVP